MGRRSKMFVVASMLMIPAGLGLSPVAAHAGPTPPYGCDDWIENQSKAVAVCKYGTGWQRVIAICAFGNGSLPERVPGPWTTVRTPSEKWCTGSRWKLVDTDHETKGVN